MEKGKQNDEILYKLGFLMENCDERYWITPIMAKTILDNLNYDNPRKPSKSTVRMYTELLKKDLLYGTSGDPIAFKKYEHCLHNGQERLMAIVRANKPLYCKVQWDEEHKEVLDRGHKRTTSMAVEKMVGEGYKSAMSSIARVKLSLDKGILAVGQSGLNINVYDTDIANDISENMDVYKDAVRIAERVYGGLKKRKGEWWFKISKSLLGGIIVHLIATKNAELSAIEDFADYILSWRDKKKVETLLSDIDDINKQKTNEKDEKSRDIMIKWNTLWMIFQGYKRNEIEYSKDKMFMVKPIYKSANAA